MESTGKNFSYSLEIKFLNGLMTIPVVEILFVEAEGKHSNIYFEDLSMVIAYHPIKWYGNYLHAPYFFRCHYSYIVNCRYIDFYTQQEITLLNKEIVPLSRNSMKLFRNNYESLASELRAANQRLRAAGYSPQPAGSKATG